MAPSVAQSWSGSYAPPLSVAAGAVPAPGNLGLAVDVAVPAGDWAVAIVTWRQPLNSPAVTIASVADDQQSWWEPLGAPQAASSPQGVTRTVIWHCPRSGASTVVQCSPTGFVLSLAMVVLDVTGMTNMIALTPVVTGYTLAGITLNMSVPPQGSSAIFFAAAGTDLLSATVTGPLGGWTSIAQVTVSNGTDATSDLALNCGWKTSSLEVDTHFSSNVNVDFSGVLGGLFAAPAALAQPNPEWPVVIPEVAIGGGQYTPADTLNWQALTSPLLDFGLTQGRQYERDELATGDGALTLWNPAGLALPPVFPQSAGIDSGTPVRLRYYWPGGSWQVQFSGDGTHGGIGVSASNGSSLANPGQVIAETAWVGLSAAYAAGVSLVTNFYDGSVTLVATFTSASQATGTVPVLLSVSGTAPAGTVFVNTQLQVAGIPPASLVVSASAGPPVPTVIPAALGAWSAFSGFTTIASQGVWAPDLDGPPNPTPWYVHSMLIERLPQTWDRDTWQGMVDAVISDQWASLTEIMRPILAAELLEDDPYALWPCTDLATANAASNLAGGVPLFVTLSKYGANSVTQAFAQNGSAIPGAQGTYLINPQFRVQAQAGMWQVTLPSPTYSSHLGGWSLVGVDTNFPLVAQGVTVEFWFQVVAPVQTGSLQNMLLTLTGGGNRNTNDLVDIFLDTPVAGGGTGNLQMLLNGTAVGPITISSVNYQVADSPITHAALSFTRTSWTSYVNGVKTNSGTIGGSGLQPSFSVLTVANFNSNVGSAVGASATFGWIAVFPRVLHPLRILTHYQAGITGMAGDPASYRAERILLASTDSVFRRFIGYETPFTAGGSGPTSVVSCSDLPGSPAGQGITNIASSTPPGMLFISPGGEIRLLTKEAAFGQPYKWVLGENVAAGEIPYESDAALGYDPQHVVNSVQLTQLDSEDVVTSQVPAVSQASQNQYGQITVNQTGFLQGDSTTPLNAGPGLFDLANWLATTGSKPLTRGETITVHAEGNPTSWPFVLGASVGDAVLLNRRPLGLATPGVISIPGRISQVKRRLVSGFEDHTEASIQCVIDAMPEVDVLTLDDPDKGQLNGVNILGWLVSS